MEAEHRMPATLALVNGRVLTIDRHDRTAEAVAILGNRIVAVGSTADVMAHTAERTTVIDLHGRTVTPGFIDAHTHIETTAHGRHLWLDLRELPRKDLMDRVAAEVAAGQPGEWIVVQATFDQDLPDRSQLDDLAPENPVVLRWSMHKQVVNSAAMRYSGIDATTPDPIGGRIRRDADGDPTGVLEEAFDALAIPPTPRPRLGEVLAETTRTLFLSQGVTTAYDMPKSRDGVRAYQELAREGRLPIRVRLFPILPPVHQPLAPLDAYTKIGLTSGFGSEWVAFGGVKLFVDGGGDAVLTRASLEAPPAKWPLLPRTYQQLTAELREARQGGIQVLMHAIGDVAQRMAIDAMAECAPDGDHRTRIEHFGNRGLPDPGLVRGLERVGAIPSPQPSFLWAEQNPAGGRFPFHTLLDAGLRPPGSSDSTGTRPQLVDPLQGIYCMVYRRNRDGLPISPEEAVTLREAIRIYTYNSAYAGFEEESKGSIEPGKLADLAIFDRDLERCGEADLRSARVDVTVIDGHMSYVRDENVLATMRVAGSVR